MKKPPARLSLQEIFSKIYNEKKWGASNSLRYYSGRGTHEKQFSLPYIDAILMYLPRIVDKWQQIKLLDIGCGDLHIGSNFFESCETYYAIDVCPELIQELKVKYAKVPNLYMKCVDSTTEPLPKADVVFVRQVFQHLSNKHIQQILDNIGKISPKCLILTERLPAGKFIENLDHSTGRFSRLGSGLRSGVNITKKPFSFDFASSEVLLEIPDGDNAVIKTIAYILHR